MALEASSLAGGALEFGGVRVVNPPLSFRL